MSKYGHMSIRPPDCLVWQVADKCPSLTDLQVVPALIDRLESPRSRNPPSSLSLLLLTAKLATIHLLTNYSQVLQYFRSLPPIITFSHVHNPTQGRGGEVEENYDFLKLVLK